MILRKGATAFSYFKCTTEIIKLVKNVKQRVL